MTRFGAKLVYDKVQDGIKDHGLRPFSRMIGVPIGVVRSASSGRDISASNLAILADALDLEFYIGPKRIPERTSLDGFAEKAAEFVYAVDGSREALREGFLPIPYHNMDPKHRGKGVAPVSFSRAWMVDLGLNPENLHMVEVPNARMSPTLRCGDLALIDSAPDDNDNLVWAFLDSGNMDIARLSFLGNDGRIIVRDHPDETPQFIPKEKVVTIATLGRVIWSGGGLV